MFANLIEKQLGKDCSSCLKKDEEALICMSCNRVDKKKKEKCVLFVTTLSISILESKGKSYSVKDNIPFDSITKLALVDKASLDIHTSKIFIALEHSNMISIFKSIYHYINSIFLASEVPKISYETKHTGKLKPNKNFGYRLKYINLKHKLKIPTATIEKLEKILTAKKLRYLDFTVDEDLLKHADSVIDCIETLTSVSEITLPKTKHVWANFLKCAKYETRISSIIICNSFDSSFKHIIEDLQNLKSCGIKRVTFRENDISDRDKDYIRTIASLKKLDTMVFDKCCNEKTFSKFLAALSKEPGFKEITHMEFISIEGIKAVELFTAAPWLEAVKFTKCNVNIPQIITKLPPYLMKLLIDTDTAMTTFEQFTPPETISTIEFKNVKWSPEALHGFLNYFVNLNPTQGFKLNFSGIIMDEKSWDNFSSYSFDVSEETTLKEFFWDNNPITPPIMKMLHDVKSLDLLAVSGSLSEQTILPFADFIESCQNLSNLVINGSNNPLNVEKSVTLLRGIRNCKNIQRLAFNEQNFGEEGLTAMCELLLANKSISYIEFENSGVSSKDAWYQFFEKLTERGPPLEILWPSEFAKLEDDGVFTQKDLDHLHDCWTNIMNGCEEKMEEEGQQTQLDFGTDIETVDEPEETIAPLDWDLQIPDIPVQGVDEIVDAKMKKFSYQSVVENLVKT